MIPLATTTIAIYRPAAGTDPYEAGSPALVASGVRAHIGSPSGADVRVGGDQQVITDRLNADLCSLEHGDTVTDLGTGTGYAVVWVRRRLGLGLDHLVAGLVQAEGAANG